MSHCNYTFVWTLDQYERAIDLLAHYEFTQLNLYVHDELGQDTAYISQIVCGESTAVMLGLL